MLQTVDYSIALAFSASHYRVTNGCTNRFMLRTVALNGAISVSTQTSSHNLALNGLSSGANVMYRRRKTEVDLTQFVCGHTQQS